MSRDEHATRQTSNCPINRKRPEEVAWKGEEEWKVGSRVYYRGRGDGFYSDSFYCALLFLSFSLQYSSVALNMPKYIADKYNFIMEEF